MASREATIRPRASREVIRRRTGTASPRSTAPAGIRPKEEDEEEEDILHRAAMDSRDIIRPRDRYGLDSYLLVLAYYLCYEERCSAVANPQRF